MHTTVAQNLAHHADLTWIKVGRSEYMRGDGVTIRKNDNAARGWEIFLPNGERPQMPSINGGFINIPAWGHSLTVAKFNAEDITAESPAYVKAAR